MKAKVVLPNRIKEACKERGVSVRELARRSGISSSKMDRIVKGEEFPALAETMKICAALNTNSYELFGLKLDKKLSHNLDDVLLGSVIVWLVEACNRFKASLSKAEYSQWASFIYKEALTESLNGDQTRYLASVVVKAVQQVNQRK